MNKAFLILVACASFAACARPFAPPGGEPDEIAPQIIATVPAPLSAVEPSEDDVVFRFDQTLSERGISDALVLVSPSTGETRVSRRGAEIRVRIEGGWQADRVYRVVLLPGARDRFGNERREPAELVFSTGPEIPEAAVAGLVLDRVTGRPATAAIVRATSRRDSVTYATVVDTVGFFSLRHLPVGTYDLSAFDDRNANRIQDPAESYARGTAITINRAIDTVTAVLTILPADTTPARITEAIARDSLQIRLTTDDYIDPDAPLQFAQASLFTLPDTVAVAGEVRVLSVAAFDSLRAAERAAADTTREVVTPPALPVEAAPADDMILPVRELVAVPAAPLLPEQQYLIRVQGLVNISRLPGGGGAATFTAPERPAAAAVDTTAVPDTVRPPPDTVRTLPDTLRVPVDTTAISRALSRARPMAAARRTWISRAR